MSEGFMIDRGHANAPSTQKWVEGEPTKSFWYGLHTKGRESFQVRTYRCDKCGYLESYATEAATK